MSFKRIILSLLLVSACSLLSSCSSRDLGEDFEIVPGTEDVMLSSNSISISPDGQFMVVLNDSIAYGSADRKHRMGIVTLNLESGVVRRHQLSSEIDEKTQKGLRRFIRNFGLYRNFQPDSWRDGMFFVYAAANGCLRVSPYSDDIEVGRWSCFDGLRSSSHVLRSYLLEIEKRYYDQGLLPYDGVYHPSQRDEPFSLSNLSMPTNSEEDSTVLYVIDREDRRVFRVDEKNCTNVFQSRGVATFPGISQILISPNGRFLAIVREKKLGLPIPLPSSGCELYLLDLKGGKRRYKWSANIIGSCAWSPDSQELYVTSATRGDGVYRLRLSDLGL